MSKRALRAGGAAIALATCAAVCGSCSSTVRQGSSPAYLIIDSLTAASGATPNAFSNFLQSDVVTMVKVTQGSDITFSPTVYTDNGQIRLRMALKDIGTPASPTLPTTNNQITITQYHVTFKRADGRNTPGVDVPYGFDGVVTGTIDAAGTSLNFEIVRAQAKFDAPLRALRDGGGAKIISTIAEVVIYGHDQAGNQVSVTGTISVDFADFPDPQ